MDYSQIANQESFDDEPECLVFNMGDEGSYLGDTNVKMRPFFTPDVLDKLPYLVLAYSIHAVACFYSTLPRSSTSWCLSLSSYIIRIYSVGILCR
jgi:hypothetical protein